MLMSFELNVVLYVLLSVSRWIYRRFFVICFQICQNSRTFSSNFHCRRNVSWNMISFNVEFFLWNRYFKLHKSIFQILSIFMINVQLFDFHFDTCDDIRINDVWSKSACFCNKYFESLQSATILTFDEILKAKNWNWIFKMSVNTKNATMREEFNILISLNL